MKKRSLIVMLVVAVLAAMCLTACGQKEPPTLESYLNDHPDQKTQIDEQLGASEELKGVTVEFSGNDMIYTCDMAIRGGITEEDAKSAEVKEMLDTGLATQADAFKGTANSVLDEVRKDGAEIEQIRIIVNYNYGDYQITSATFESDPVE